MELTSLSLFLYCCDFISGKTLCYNITYVRKLTATFEGGFLSVSFTYRLRYHHSHIECLLIPIGFGHMQQQYTCTELRLDITLLGGFMYVHHTLRGIDIAHIEFNHTAAF